MGAQYFLKFWEPQIRKNGSRPEGRVGSRLLLRTLNCAAIMYLYILFDRISVNCSTPASLSADWVQMKMSDPGNGGDPGILETGQEPFLKENSEEKWWEISERLSVPNIWNKIRQKILSLLNWVDSWKSSMAVSVLGPDLYVSKYVYTSY